MLIGLSRADVPIFDFELFIRLLFGNHSSLARLIRYFHLAIRWTPNADAGTQSFIFIRDTFVGLASPLYRRPPRRPLDPQRRTLNAKH